MSREHGLVLGRYGRCGGDVGEMWGRYGRDMSREQGLVLGRYGGDLGEIWEGLGRYGEIWGRYGGDIGEIWRRHGGDMRRYGEVRFEHGLVLRAASVSPGDVGRCREM